MTDATSPLRPSTTDPGPVLVLRDICHAFGTNRVLHDLHLDVVAGEVHAVVGENGAGKSTLLRIAAGLLAPDAGTVEVAGRPLAAATRAAAVAAGVGVVHQHFSLVGTMTGSENFLLGRPGSGVRLDGAAAVGTLRSWAERTGLPVDPDRVVDDLSIVERQRLEILTALGWGARVLLLDEPTAVLSPVEADQLLAVVRQLAADEGLGVVLVTHKMREVEEYADRATVIRGGEVVATHHARDVDRDRLVAEMVGASDEDAVLYEPRRPREVAVGEVRVRTSGLRGQRMRGIDLEFRSYEVVGVAAVAGSGEEELVAAIAGLSTPADGSVEIVVDGVATPVVDAGGATRSGVAVIPADRDRDALAPDLPVWVNAVAKVTDRIGSWRGIDRSAVTSITTRVVDKLGVRPARHDLPARRLSGGNQQRLVIGRELDRDPRVVVASEPTRGLDPSSALAVIDALRGAASSGAAVIVTASDLDELVVVADRIVALCDGRVTLDVPVGDADRQTIGRAMAGVS